jgi:hypothetical protein
MRSRNATRWLSSSIKLNAVAVRIQAPAWAPDAASLWPQFSGSETAEASGDRRIGLSATKDARLGFRCGLDTAALSWATFAAMTLGRGICLKGPGSAVEGYKALRLAVRGSSYCCARFRRRLRGRFFNAIFLCRRFCFMIERYRHRRIPQSNSSITLTGQPLLRPPISQFYGVM